MKRASLLNVILMLTATAAAAFGQAQANGMQEPAAPPAAPAAPPVTAAKPLSNSTAPSAAIRVAVINFNDAVLQNTEGKAAYQKFQSAVGEKEKDFAADQKTLQDLQTKLQTQDKSLSDDAKATMNRQIDQLNTRLQRMNEDAQKDLGDLQQQLFTPIAGRVREVMNAYAKELGYSLVYDVSAQGNNLVYYDPVADITTEVIRRVDAAAAKGPAKATTPAAAPKTTPAAPATPTVKPPATSTTPATPPKAPPDSLSL